ncbi:MAG: MFS transporter [Rhabdochlamydiaceae bacterium]|nr:MFS transporter [Rhabdochlamydiaceae bacterium]
MKAASVFSQRHYYAGIVGNVLEHYDIALFGFLAPFLSPLFFSSYDHLTGLILTYALLPLGILARPLGALFFGWIGDAHGRKRALCFSLGFMALVTALMGLLPTFATVGYWAPILLALLRALQGFCIAGESSGGAIFILEEIRTLNKSLISSLYSASSIAGILLACGSVAWMAGCGRIEEGWRYLYFLGSLTALVGLVLRMGVVSCNRSLSCRTARNFRQITQVLRLYFPVLCAIACTAGFSSTTYCQAMTLMHGYIPLITSYSKADVMHWNTYLLLLDLCLLPCFGYLAARFSKESLMRVAAFLSGLLAVPLFLMLPNAAFVTIIAVRVALIVLGVAFAAPWHAWVQELVAREHRYTVISLGTAIGSQLIGSPGPAVGLWIFQKTGWAFAPALYLVITAALAFIAVNGVKLLSLRMGSVKGTS